MIRNGKAFQLFAELLREATADAETVLDIGTSQRFAKELAPFRLHIPIIWRQAIGPRIVGGILATWTLTSRILLYRTRARTASYASRSLSTCKIRSRP